MSFHGRIDSIYFDKYNHNSEYLLLSDGVKKPLNEHWQFRLKKGDSIVKDAGYLAVYDVLINVNKKYLLLIKPSTYERNIF